MPIKNRARLRRKLLALPEVVKVAVRLELEKGAEQLVAMQKTLVPVLADPDPRRTAGALKDSIRWVYGEAPGGTLGARLGRSRGTPPSGISDTKITVFAGGPEAFYARWIEHGTVKMPAQPFFYPPYRFMNKRIRRAATNAAKKAIKKLAQSNG